ncbi:amino acid/amide ABC transporter membrane protein 1, HAAT family [Limimonas halophila]|uniref:Amino acid/amide ABC transporter membrane protein 1, HAAT family n=1 Tax=Limimonas halophila TaxID=1082479 RepID=A0A1G7TBL5_9PROT|nr:branched-chain amino acid ABC transporter permease [Limimonas halophila]SDG32698.1 amino acid/amide ABC transporter membrane protein 1, HAAT family [Limimonas halophila]
MELADFALQMVSGLQRGAIFVLIALGLTLIFGTLGVVNFAHGALYMLGAYLGFVVISYAGHWTAFIAVPLALFVIGIALERGLIRYFYQRPVTDQILVTFGLALVIQELMRWIFGGTNLPYKIPTWAAIPVDIGIGFYPPWRLLIIGVTAAVVLALFLLFRYTRFGLVVRAGMRDPEMLKFLGINVTQRFSIVFGLGALLAGIAGVMGAPTTGVVPEVGMHVLVPSFLVVVIGGMGSIPGAVVAGLLLGVAKSLTVMLYPPLSDVILYVVAAVVILWRPRGLMGLKGVME